MTNIDRSPFGRRMSEARRGARLTQNEVARRLGIAQATLSELERTAQGTRKIVEFANLYRVSGHWLATGEGSMTSMEAREPEHGLWPFQIISKERWDALTERQKGAVEQVALSRLEEIERSSDSPKPRTRK